MLLHSTLLCTKIARAPVGQKIFMLTTLGEGRGGGGGGQKKPAIDIDSSLHTANLQ